MRIELLRYHGREDLSNECAAMINTNTNELASKVMNARYQEKDELLEFAETLLKGSDKRANALSLMKKYGGVQYIFQRMKEIDPKYQTLEEVCISMGDALLDSLVSLLDISPKDSS